MADCGLFSPLTSLWSRLRRVDMNGSNGSYPASNTTIYFGYGSNLWQDQMKRRCPKSKYLGIARLKGFRWIIYERGYANVVEISDDDDDDDDEQLDGEKDDHSYADEVWGLVYSLQPSDEARLDVNEGVPVAYVKEDIDVEFWPAVDGKAPDPRAKPKIVTSLVYINRKLTDPAKPKEEYVYRMNMGIHDALQQNVPSRYVKQVMREYIPEPHDDIARS